MSDEKKKKKSNYNDNGHCHEDEHEYGECGSCDGCGSCGGREYGGCDFDTSHDVGDVPSGVLYRVVIDGVANGFIVSEYLRTPYDNRTVIQVFEKKNDLERALKEMLDSIEEEE